MVENTCFICLNEVNDDIHHFDESELAQMICDCYKHKPVHSQCFHAYLKKKTENKNKCAVCRSSILDNNNLLIESVKNGKNYKNFNIICRLLEEGVDINAKDEGGITALMWAICKGNIEIIKMLLKKGADVNAKDKNGVSVLALSVMSPSRCRKREIVSILLDKGADVNAVDNFGLTAVMWAYKDLKNFDLELVSMLQKKKKEIKDARPSLYFF